MTNAELIKALRHCGKNQECSECPLWGKPSSACMKLLLDAVDALEAADEKIADCIAAVDALDDSNDAYIKENEQLKKRIAEMEEERNKTVTEIFCEEQSWWENRCKELEAQNAELVTKCIQLEAQIPKRGEWIMCESEKPYIVCKCSVCGGLTSEGGHYCPNCGARMQTVTDCHTLEEGEHDE